MVGNNASKGELEDAFSYYGRLRSVWVARNPPGFAFIEFEDPRDAEDAVRGLDGRYGDCFISFLLVVFITFVLSYLLVAGKASFFHALEHGWQNLYYA